MGAIRREQYLEELREGRSDKDVVKVVTGMRRCGKSTLLEQFKGDLLDSGVPEEDIIHLNLESFEGQGYTTYKELNEMLESRVPTDRDSYILLDEIQNVEGWEKSVAALCTIEMCDVYLTGSNSSMLSTELSTHISGRYIEIDMLPFSFKEYIQLHSGSDVNKLFSDYLRYGSLPEVDPAKGERFCQSYIEGVFNTVLVKDILSRVKTDDVRRITSIARFLYSNIGNTTNIAAISKGSGISPVTSDRYVTEMENALLFYHSERYDIVGKRLLQTNGKYYASDLGMRNVVLKGAKGTDVSRPLENVVFLELIRRGYTVRTGSYRDLEVDFTALKGGSTEYYQVTLTMMSEDTRTRELRPLEDIRDNYSKTILTLDRFGLGSENGIRIVNVIDWLLGQDR